MADSRTFNFNGPTVFNDIHDNKDCTIVVPAPTDNVKSAAGEMATKPKRQKPERTSTLPQLGKDKESTRARDLNTFKKKGILEGNIRVLYSQMVEAKWIEPETLEQDFVDLFSGELSEGKIIWSKKYGKGTLVFLFQYFETQEVITVPRGHTIPNILMGHFVDKEGNYLTNLDNGDAPNDAAGKEIQAFLNTLMTKAFLTDSRGNGSSDYDDSLNPYELDKEGLRYQASKHGSGRNSGME